MLLNETEKLAQYIEDLKTQEFEKIHYYFLDLQKELERREKQLKTEYYEQVKGVENILKKDIEMLQKRMQEFDEISNKLKEKMGRFKMSNDLAIVANAYEVFELQRKVKNNNFEGKRLEMEDEDLYNESNNFEDSPDVYNYSYKPKPKTKDQNKKMYDKNQENNGEHVFFVQLDSELPMPHFLINISKEKKKIETIGTIKNSFLSNQNLMNPDLLESESAKIVSDTGPPHFSPIKPNDYKRHQEEVKQFLENYNGVSNSLYPKFSPGTKKPNLHNLSYNNMVADSIESPIKIQNFEEQIIQSNSFLGQEMFWFKWDTYD
jgi:hypothetical protein